MRLFFWLCAFFLLPAGGAYATTPAYSLLDLGPASDQKAGINDLGQTVFTRGGNVLRYTDGIGVDAVASGYGRPALGGINDGGQVSFADASKRYSPILRATDGAGAVVIGETVAPFESGVSVTRPNARGDVAYAGTSIITYYSDFGSQQLVPSDPWLDLGYVNGINDAGTIIYGNASSYQGHEGYGVGGAWNYRDGPLDMGPIRWGSALNNRGDIAGSVGNMPAIRWADGAVTQINKSGFCIALNDLGMAVGASSYTIGPDGLFAYARPWVFDASGARDLNNLIDPALGWNLWYASDINNAGQIAGTGFVSGQRHAFRLTPVSGVPEPGSLALVATAMAPLVIRGRRRRANPANPNAIQLAHLPCHSERAKNISVTVTLRPFAGSG